MELLYLPPYSSDLNPDEHINADVKYRVGSKSAKRTKERLQAATEEYRNMLNKAPSRLIKYFKDPAIQYAT
jgi:transposase